MDKTFLIQKGKKVMIMTAQDENKFKGVLNPGWKIKEIKKEKEFLGGDKVICKSVLYAGILSLLISLGLLIIKECFFAYTCIFMGLFCISIDLCIKKGWI